LLSVASRGRYGQRGAEAYILKPFHAAYLIAVINNLLKQRELIVRKIRDNAIIDSNALKITSKDEVFLNNIVDIIKENLSESEFNVEKLVEKSFISRTVLYNKVKAFTGLSPVELIRQMRLKAAADLLVYKGYNVSEAAYMSGFNDLKYFSKCFKSLYEKTPSEYKNSQKQLLN
jgi:AraC-like DNA-binding protein